MNRRAFLSALSGSLLAAPLAVEAQQAGKVPRIGLLDYAPFWEPLRHGLRELGYVEDQSIILEYRRAEGRHDRLPGMAVEIVRQKVDVIVAYGTPATQAAKQATSTIPIVMVGTGDPLKTGLVRSLAHPGGNVTGNTIMAIQITTKRLQLLVEAVPRLSRVALLWNPRNAANAVQFEEMKSATRALGVTMLSLEARSPEEIDTALTTVVEARPQGVMVTADAMLTLHVRRIIDAARASGLPTMYQLKENAEAGALMSYGPSLPELFRRAAIYVDRILKGVKPADLPVEQPSKFELVINLKTAKALGLTIPPSLLQRADQVIE
jgi:putative tryptophan/tyrosine transport system substrate-binding protein